VFGDRVVLGGVERRCIFDVEFFLPGFGFTLGVLHRDARTEKAVADRAQHILFLGRLQDMIVLVVAGDRLEIAEAFLADLIETFLEQEEFQFGRHDRRQPHVGQAGHLRLQHGARRMRNILVRVMILDIAHHHGCGFEPGNPAEARKIRLHHVVAIAARPARRRISLDRIHLDVGRQQVIAAMGLVIGRIDEMLGVEALAHQPSLHIDDTRKHRVDLAG